MDKNKVVLWSISCAMICATLSFLGYLHHLRLKDKEIENHSEHNIYSQYTFCVRSVMEKSRENEQPCSALEAEKICDRFNH